MVVQIKISDEQNSISANDFKKAHNAYSSHDWINLTDFPKAQKVRMQCSICHIQASKIKNYPNVFFGADGFYIQYSTCNENVIKDIII